MTDFNWPSLFTFDARLFGTQHTTLHMASPSSVWDESYCPYCHPKAADRRPSGVSNATSFFPYVRFNGTDFA